MDRTRPLASGGPKTVTTQSASAQPKGLCSGHGHREILGETEALGEKEGTEDKAGEGTGRVHRQCTDAELTRPHLLFLRLKLSPLPPDVFSQGSRGHSGGGGGAQTHSLREP